MFAQWGYHFLSRHAKFSLWFHYLLLCHIHNRSFLFLLDIFLLELVSRYVISAVSPSRVDPLVWNYHFITLCFLSYLFVYFNKIWGCLYCFVQIGVEKSYEILCKTFNNEAKAILEVKFYSISFNVITDRHYESTGCYSMEFLTKTNKCSLNQFTPN